MVKFFFFFFYGQIFLKKKRKRMVKGGFADLMSDGRRKIDDFVLQQLSTVTIQF